MRNRITVLFLLAGIAAVSAQEKPDAVELYRSGEYQAAIDVCRQELEEMPNRMDAHAVLGWSLLRLRRYQEALDASEVAFRISRYDPRIIETAGQSLYFLGRQSEALRYFEEYAAISPTGGRIDLVYYYMGEIFIQQGRYNNADIALATALYHSPNVADWWARLGYAREKAGDFQWSLEAYNKALALNPNLVDAIRGRSRVQQQL
jgi:tetratricopeptide (TPR) repeat protein